MNIKSRYIIAGITLLVVLWILYYFSDLVTYVVLAWSLSMIGAPIVKFLRRFLGKNLAAIATIFIFVLISTLLLWMFIPPLLEQARNISNIDYGKAIKALEEPINDWQSMLVERGLYSQPEKTNADSIPIVDLKPTPEPEFIQIDTIVRNDSIPTAVTIVLNLNDLKGEKEETNEQIDKSKSFFDHARDNILSFINPARIQNILTGLIGFLGNFIIAIFSIFFICFFFLREQGLFTNIISSAVPDKFVYETEHAIATSSELLVRYFIGIATQVTVITTLVTILLSLFGIQNALLIGFFAALMNVIPYIGPLLGASFAAIITFTSNLDLSFYDELLPVLGKVAIVFIIMQMIDNFIIQPFIFGKSVKAHPLEIFLIVLVGAKLGGILGMVLAIPVYTVLRVIGKVFLSEFKLIQRLTRSI